MQSLFDGPNSEGCRSCLATIAWLCGSCDLRMASSFSIIQTCLYCYNQYLSCTIVYVWATEFIYNSVNRQKDTQLAEKSPHSIWDCLINLGLIAALRKIWLPRVFWGGIMALPLRKLETCQQSTWAAISLCFRKHSEQFCLRGRLNNDSKMELEI